MPGRNILLVMERILEVIPDDYLFKLVIGCKFQEIRSTIHYVPPENRQPAWERLCRVLEAYLSDPASPHSPEWMRAVSDIITDKESIPNEESTVDRAGSHYPGPRP